MKSRPEGNETTEETRALIALSLIPGIGSSRIRALVSHFNSASGVFAASQKELSKVDGIGVRTARSVLAFNGFDKVTRQIECAHKADAKLITYWSDEYPALLRSIFDPPAFLWVRGRIPASAFSSIAIVGTRKPSLYGKKVTSNFTAQLSKLGFVITSGLAYGIDAIAHRTVLDAGGCTLAVLGSGVDTIYPSKHQALARSIMERGAIISEYPLQAKPDAANFPKRNRIISGLSVGTLLTEAYDTGGALITARLAVEQNREVFAVPGSIYNKASSGIHTLIQRGHAKLVGSVQDILEELDMVSEAENRMGVNEEEHCTLNAIEKQLFELITDEPVQINTLCEKSGLDPSTALVYLLGLEFKGMIYQMAGKQFYRA